MDEILTDIECRHLLKDGTGACIECGCYSSDISMEGLGRNRMPSAEVINIIKSLSFPDSVKNEALTIYKKIVANKTTKNRKKEVSFFCVFQAHQRLGIAVEPGDLGTQFSLTRTEARTSIATYNVYLHRMNERTNSFVNPKRLIDKYCKDLGLTEDVAEEILSMFNSTCKRSPTLKNQTPITGVASLIYLYMKNVGMEVDPDQYASVFRIAFSTVESAYKSIKREIDM